MRQAMGASENECYDSVELNAMETDRDGRISKNFASTLFGKDLAYPDSSKYFLGLHLLVITIPSVF